MPEEIAEPEKLAQKQPNSVGPATAVAVLYEMQNNKEEARKRYERIIETHPRAAIAANNLAWAYAEKGENLDVALQLAQTAKSQLPDIPQVNDTLGWVYYRKGLPDLAIPPLELSVKKDPKNAQYHYHLGLAYLKAGKRDKARESLEAALKLQPDFQGADEARSALASLKG